MSNRGWHIERNDAGLTLSRDGNAHFDVSASVVLPLMAREKLAHQIRQDMWRALRNLRGFSPVVRIQNQNDSLHVTAGGAVASKTFAKSLSEDQITSVLTNPQNQRRWRQFAGAGQHV